MPTLHRDESTDDFYIKFQNMRIGELKIKQRLSHLGLTLKDFDTDLL